MAAFSLKTFGVKVNRKKICATLVINHLEYLLLFSILTNENQNLFIKDINHDHNLTMNIDSLVSGHHCMSTNGHACEV